MIGLLVCFATWTPQIVETLPSTFLEIKGDVYEASPIYSIKAASPDERLVWSFDGMRLAAVSTLGSESPRTSERRIAKGELPQAPLKVGVWSRDSGQYREVFVPQDPMTSIDSFVFVGHDLLLSTGKKLWFVPDGGKPKEIAFPDDALYRLIPAPQRSAVLIVSEHRIWLMDTQQTREVQAPKPGPYFGRGVVSEGKAALVAGGDWLTFDFAAGTFTSVAGQPSPVSKSFPFILDAYNHSGGLKAALIDEDPEATKVDARSNPVAEEDGGYRLDLVEKAGVRRRRMRFIPEMARTVEVSGNGFAFAFLSNRTLMVRWLVKLNPGAAKQRLGAGALQRSQ